MESLDLSSYPPRGPRERLVGCMFLARTVDKLRAELPGGNLGAYVVDGPRTVSGYVLHKLGLNVDELRAVVGAALDEDEVVTWLRERTDPALIAEVNGKLENARIDGLTSEHYAFVAKRHPLLRDHPEIATTFELLEADDAATFA